MKTILILFLALSMGLPAHASEQESKTANWVLGVVIGFLLIDHIAENKVDRKIKEALKFQEAIKITKEPIPTQKVEQEKPKDDTQILQVERVFDVNAKKPTENTQINAPPLEYPKKKVVTQPNVDLVQDGPNKAVNTTDKKDGLEIKMIDKEKPVNATDIEKKESAELLKERVEGLIKDMRPGVDNGAKK